MSDRCDATRLHLLDYQRGRLDPAAHAMVHAHLEECRECAHEDVVEQGLSAALDRELPQYPAPRRLKRELATRWKGPIPAPARRSRWLRPSLVAAGAAAALLLGVFAWPGSQPPLVAAAVVGEAINDHLRILEPGRRLDVPSDDVHQVRPWFAGRLDFSPAVPFPGDAEFPLRGGAIERFLDRRAAVFVYGRRLHTISLLVFRSDGLPWPDDAGAEGTTTSGTVRGFNVLLWRNGDLGYALVSDLNPAELTTLGGRLAAPPTRP